MHKQMQTALVHTLHSAYHTLLMPRLQYIYKVENHLKKIIIFPNYRSYAVLISFYVSVVIPAGISLYTPMPSYEFAKKKSCTLAVG